MARCALRSQQWQSERSLFTSALAVCPLNAKVPGFSLVFAGLQSRPRSHEQVSAGPLQCGEEPGRQRERHRRHRLLPGGRQVILLAKIWKLRSAVANFSFFFSHLVC